MYENIVFREFATEVLPVIDNLERALATNVEDPKFEELCKRI